MAADKEQREVEIKLNAQQANASIKDMAAGVALMNNQLAKMSQDDPRRQQLQRDFQVLTQRVGAARAELRTYVQTEEEVRAATEKLNKQNVEVILNGQKLNASFKDMKASAAQLEQQLEQLSGDDPGRKKMLADYHALQERIAGVKTEMKGATEGTSFLKQGFANAFALFAGGGLIGLAQQLFSFFSASREEYLGSAKSAADLEATLVATKNAAGLTADEIRKIGEERAKVTLFDDDETNRASAMLLTFKNVKKGVFEEAIPAIQDLATKMAGDGPADLKGASIQLGKALNDPITGVTKLTKVGVTFTEQQKEQITQMVKMGDTAGAQRVILSELNSEFGGSAEAARKAGGGVATLSMRWNEFKETVGGKVSGVLDSLSQWLGRVLDKAQPLLDMVSELGDEFMDYYHDISDLVEGLGLFNEKTDTAQLVINGLKYALTLLLLPLKAGLEISRALVNAFIDWYNKSELLRGVLGGLGAVVVSLFTTIKDDALKILGGVGDILIGIFTLDKNKIVAGFKSAMAATADVMLEGGSKAADAFLKGYEANKNNHIIRTVRVTTQEASPSGGTAAVGEETPVGESSAAKKEREAAEKKAKAARDKADQERLSDLKKWVKEQGDVLEGSSELERARQQAADTDELKRREAQRRKIMQDASAKYQDLLLLEGNHTLQMQQVLDDRDLALRELQTKWDEEDKKKKEQELQEKLAAAETENTNSITALEQTHTLGLVTEQEYQDQLYFLQKQGLEKRLALLEAAGQSETKEAAAIRAALAKADGEQVKKKKAQEEDLAKFNAHMAAQTAHLLTEGLTLVEDNLDKKSTAYELFKAARKTAALAEIGINLQEEIQEIWKAASANPLNGVTGGAAGTTQGVIQTGLAVVRAAAAGIKIAGFYEGGPTGGGVRAAASGMWHLLGQATGLGVSPGGQLLDAQGLEVAGIVHKNEYVIPEWMRQDPQVLQVESWLEARRQRGFYEGGPTTAGDTRASGTVPASGSEQAAPGNAQLVQVLASLDQRLQKVEDWPTQLEVVLDLLALDRAQQKIKRVKASSEIRPK